ncbi:MAG: c-type cytochrome [Thermoanaerobaculia bacterium]
MKLWVFAAVALVLLAFGLGPRFVRPLRRFAPGPLEWFVLWLGGLWAILELGFEVPVPDSIVQIYLGIASLALLLYVSADRERLERTRRPLVAFMTERRFLPLLVAVVLAVPTLFMANVYLGLTAPPAAPSVGRTLHPEPPTQITVHDEPVNLVTATNPYRHLEEDDPEAFQRHVANGRRVYYENCFYCHGDLMRGDGMYAEELSPIPTNFTSTGTIEQLQESFLFWRIAKGGPGMPPAGTPWDSAMPAWEDFLTEQEMWEVILFLYDFTDRRPRARHETVVEE